MKNFDVRKIFAVVFSVLVAFPLLGQKLPSAKFVVANMQESLKNGGTMKFEFVFRAENSEGKMIEETEGTFVAENESFKMNTPALEMYCDGVSKWLYDIINEEVTIFPHDPNTIEIAENPFSVLSKITSEEYSFRSGVKELQEKGVKSYRIVIVPKDKSLSYSELVLTVSSMTWLPSVMEYMSVSGDRYVLKITNAVSVPAKGTGYFTPSEELLGREDVYITDLR